MASLLYVTCNVKSRNQSRSMTLGYEFLEEYLRWNPRDEVQELDLYRDSIQRVDQDVLSAKGRIERGEDYGLFSPEERRKLTRIWSLADQFVRNDKYVFVTHSLNLWFPAEFKMYIDTICVPDRSYRLTPQGAEGMLHDQFRKSLHLHAGPPYKFLRQQDRSAGYLQSVLSFLGVKNQDNVFLEGDHPEHGTQEEYEAARRSLLDLARGF